MSRNDAITGAIVFFLAAPLPVAGVLPFLITGWRQGPDASAAMTLFGVVLILGGLALLVECFWRFATRGAGTPAPLAPPEVLVVSGAYQYVRNPMYVGVTAILLGQVLVFASAAMVAYSVAIWTAFHLFIIFYEEPTLERVYPQQYPIYRNAVRRWIPRLRPWRQPPQEKDREAAEA